MNPLWIKLTAAGLPKLKDGKPVELKQGENNPAEYMAKFYENLAKDKNKKVVIDAGDDKVSVTTKTQDELEREAKAENIIKYDFYSNADGQWVSSTYDINELLNELVAKAAERSVSLEIKREEDAQILYMTSPIGSNCQNLQQRPTILKREIENFIKRKGVEIIDVQGSPVSVIV